MKKKYHFFQNEYSITIKKRSVHIINYIEIVDFSSNRVVVRYDGGESVILGSDLIVSKMLSDEVLILGVIREVQV